MSNNKIIGAKKRTIYVGYDRKTAYIVYDCSTGKNYDEVDEDVPPIKKKAKNGKIHKSRLSKKRSG